MSNSRRPRSPQLSTRDDANRSTPLVVGVVVLLCIGAIVALALVLKGGDPSATKPAAKPPSSAATAESTGGGPLGCSTPPALPANPQSFSAAPAPSTAADATWVAHVTTNCGDITLELAGDKAPQTVASFLFLTGKNFYDDTPCHRLTTAASGIFVLQCGDPTGAGSGGPGYEYGVENAPKDGSYPAGTLAMARSSDPNSNGSQFFIVYDDTTLPTDGGGYSIFGRVTSGLDLVRAVAKQGVAGGGGDGAPAQPISILEISVQKK